MARILVIEDDRSIVEGLQLALAADGHEVVAAYDGHEGARLLSDCSPDLVLLDVMLPGTNGLDLLRRLRRNRPDLPVLIVSALGSERDKVQGLELGADDYVAKPFGSAELRARVRAALRRAAPASRKQRIESFGDVQVDFDRLEVRRAGRLVPLTAREFDVLAFFLHNPDRVLTRDTLLAAVWKIRFLSKRTIDNFVLRLRTKLEPDPEHPRYFVTVRGVGYRFVPEGEPAGEDPAPGSA